MKKKFANSKRRASVSMGAMGGANTQDQQRAAVALQQDFMALVTGEEVMLWPSAAEADHRDPNTGMEVTMIEEAKEYFTKNGTIVKWMGMEVVLNGTINCKYEEVVKACAMREVMAEEPGGAEDEDETAVSLPLEERLPYGGMQLQEIGGAVYVRAVFGGSAEKSGVKTGCKVVAVKGMPFTTLYQLSETYLKFKIKVGDQVQYTFDYSQNGSLFANPAVNGELAAPPLLGKYKVVGAGKFRAHVETDSPEMGSLEMGSVISYAEAITNEQGQTRVKVDRGDAPPGWVSEKTGKGAQILERLNGESVHTGTPQSHECAELLYLVAFPICHRGI